MTTIVLFGGASDERQVSVATAQNVARTLGNPLCWFWSPGGAIHDIAVEQLLAHENPFEADFDPKRPAIWPDLDQALDTLPVEDPVFFLALHGGAGEDGTVQAMMERRGIAFTGSGSHASALAFDKARAKEQVKGRVTTAESRIVEGPQTVHEMLDRYDRVVLKPVSGGSSRGLFFVNRGDHFRVDPNVPYLVEQFIKGRELTVGVLDRGAGPFALPVIEIEVDPGRAFDYQGKYLGKGTREICPAKIPDDMARAAQQTALAAHKTLGCDGYTRSDVMAAGDGIYFLETNTLPGLTKASLVPQELKVIGLDFRQFLDEQIAIARRRAGKALHKSGASR